MGFELPADPGDPGSPDVQLGRVAGAAAGAKGGSLRDGVQVLAHGALVCPSCAIPLAATAPFPVGARLVCGYCEHTGPAREFLAEDVFDTVSNEV